MPEIPYPARHPAKQRPWLQAPTPKTSRRAKDAESGIDPGKRQGRAGAWKGGAVERGNRAILERKQKERNARASGSTYLYFEAPLLLIWSGMLEVPAVTSRFRFGPVGAACHGFSIRTSQQGTTPPQGNGRESPKASSILPPESPRSVQARTCIHVRREFLGILRCLRPLPPWATAPQKYPRTGEPACRRD